MLLTNEGSDNTLHIVIVFFPFSAFFGCIKCLNMQQASSKANLTNSLKHCFQQHLLVLNDFLVDQLSNFSSKFPADCESPLDNRCMYLRTIFPLLLTWWLEMCFASG